MSLSWEQVSGACAGPLGVLVVGSALKHLWLRQARAAREELYVKVGQVSAIHIYPIKSSAAIQPPPEQALATRVGFEYQGLTDRRWMVVDASSGRWLNMKKIPRMTLVACASDGQGMLLDAPGMTTLRLPLNPNPNLFSRTKIDYHGDIVEALDAGQEASEWLSRYLGLSVRLVRSGPGIDTRDAYNLKRPWSNTARRGDEMVFAYMTSYLLTTTSSLDDVNTQLANKVTSLNFRPNIVVENTIPFDEDSWEEIRIGRTAQFHYVEPCRRCGITTIDPKTAESDVEKQPLKTLKSYRQKDPYGHSPLFGAYIGLDKEGLVSIGDPVYAIRRK